jgi:polysaccharide biosynthesis protein PslH
MRWWEPRYAARFDRCVALSEIDRAKLVAVNPSLRIDVVPNGTDTRLLQPLPRSDARPALLYVGNMDYTANAHAVIYFCKEILPLVRRAVNDVELWIVGSDPLPEVRRLVGDGIRVTGRVDDVVPYYRQSSVCIVPLRAGSGIRLKILESMALGRPVVSTSLGCEGLDVEDGTNIMIADSTEQFAEKTIRLLTDAALRDSIASNARQLVETHYDWDAIAHRMMGIYGELTR